MESPEKKKLAVVAGKRVAEEGDSADSIMEDLCRKKFKPIAPKPVMRKDQHQAGLSMLLPMKKDASQRKEHVVLPTPKFDPSSAFVMRPGSSLPFMCGGPMIMPIPVPVVPGKDGSYVPLQVPVPIPVMVPVVVSLSQAASISASSNPATVISDSKRNRSCSGEDNASSGKSKKDNGNKKGHSKQDKSTNSEDSTDSKGAKVKPCRYKYSMIKNGSLFRDILRGVGGDFMASHGITLAVPSSDSFDTNNASKNVTATTQNKQNINENISRESDNRESERQPGIDKRSDQDKSAEPREDSLNAEIVSGVSGARAQQTRDEGKAHCGRNDSYAENSQNLTNSTSNITSTSHVSVMTPSTPVTGIPNQPLYSTHLTMTTAAAQGHVTCTSVSSASTKTLPSSSQPGTSVSQQSNFQHVQGSSTSVQVSAVNSSGTVQDHAHFVRDSRFYSTGTSAQSVLHYNSSGGMQTSSTSTPMAEPTHSRWNFSQGNRHDASGQEHPNRTLPKPFHNLAERIAAVQNSEHDHPDESNFYSMDELHSFSVEMDQSAGSLLSSSDDSVNAVLGMADVGGAVPVATALSDSPTRRAVTAIVTPLPRSIPLTTSTSTIATVASHVSETGRNTSQAPPVSVENPLIPIPRSSNQVTQESTVRGSNPVDQFLSNIASSAQPAQQWSSGSSQSQRQPNNVMSTVQNTPRISTNTESSIHGNQPMVSANFNMHNSNQQRSVQMSGLQNRPCSTAVSSNPISAEHVSIAASSTRGSNPSAQSSLPCSASSLIVGTNQRHRTSVPSNSFNPRNVNLNQPCAPALSFQNNSNISSVNYTSQSRSGNSIQSSRTLPGDVLVGNAPSVYPNTMQAQTKPSSYPLNSNANEASSNKANTVHSSRRSESQRNVSHSSAPQSSHPNQLGSRSQAPRIPVVSNTHPVLSGFNSANFYTPARVQAPVTQTYSGSAVMTATTASISAPSNTMWQPPWSGNVPVRQSHTSFSDDATEHQRTGPNSSGQRSNQSDHPVPSGRNDSARTEMASASIQSVPLQSNVQTRSSMVETLPPNNQTGNHAGISDTRVCTASHPPNPGPVQGPVFSGSNQRQPPGNKANSATFPVPTSDPGPRMPYPLVPPIMFGNSAPARSIPMGGIHSVGLPRSFPSTSLSEQYVQPSQVISSSPSTVHRPITPVVHDRHRMYLPSHYNTLHRPLYMPPSPAPSTDLPLLSPHSYGQLHVHDSVLYSPRYPSSIHSLSPGVNTNFHTSSLHRSFPSSDHQETFNRNNITHPSPHYEGTLPPMPLRMSQIGQNSSGVIDAVSSHPIQVPPSVTSLQHSSILANREQNTLFEQNLQRLLERSARRHSAALASSHGYPRSMPCEHSFPHRTMSGLSTLSSLAPSHSACSVSFSTPSMLALSQSSQPQPVSTLPPQPVLSRQTITTSPSTIAATTSTTMSTTLTPTTSTIVTSRAILGNTSDKYLPLELLTPDTANAQTTPTTCVSSAMPQVASDQVVKCGDTVLQCSRQVLRESGRTVLCCWFCDYHTAEPRKMKRHQKKESEPLRCQLCSFQSESRCSVNQHYKQEHMDKDDPFRSVQH